MIYSSNFRVRTLESERRRFAKAGCSILLFASVLLLTAVATEAFRPRLRPPIHVRMVASVGMKPEGVRPEFDWVVFYGGKRYELYVLHLTVLGGNVMPLDIDAAVAPYRVKFQLAGEKTALQRL